MKQITFLLILLFSFLSISAQFVIDLNIDKIDYIEKTNNNPISYFTLIEDGYIKTSLDIEILQFNNSFNIDWNVEKDTIYDSLDTVNLIKIGELRHYSPKDFNDLLNKTIEIMGYSSDTINIIKLSNGLMASQILWDSNKYKCDFIHYFYVKLSNSYILQTIENRYFIMPRKKDILMKADDNIFFVDYSEMRKSNDYTLNSTSLNNFHYADYYYIKDNALYDYTNSIMLKESFDSLYFRDSFLIGIKSGKKTIYNCFLKKVEDDIRAIDEEHGKFILLKNNQIKVINALGEPYNGSINYISTKDYIDCKIEKHLERNNSEFILHKKISPLEPFRNRKNDTIIKCT